MGLPDSVGMLHNYSKNITLCMPLINGKKNKSSEKHLVLSSWTLDCKPLLASVEYHLSLKCKAEIWNHKKTGRSNFKE